MIEMDPSSNPSQRPPIEVGWVLAGPMENTDLQALRKAHHTTLRWLQEMFPTFRWQMPIVQRREANLDVRSTPISLIDMGVTERDARKWDFVFVVTTSDLTSYYKPFALAVPSQPLNVAALSTARLDTGAGLHPLEQEDRVQQLARRIHALVLHQFGHLNDLEHSEDPEDIMYNLNTAEDLDAMQHLSETSSEALHQELATEADLRLEEQVQKVRQRWRFYLRAAWINRDDIWGAVRNLHPWQFPLRFSRLTTAAFSTLLILLTTAEAWDLGTSQPLFLVTILSVLTLIGTSYYILKQQQLLLRRRKDRPSEQRVVAHLSIILAVFSGMAATYLMLFGATLLVALTFFSLNLVQSWISTEGPLTRSHYLHLAGFVASMGLLIGSLGASFEEQTYFRHVAFVTEET